MNQYETNGLKPELFVRTDGIPRPEGWMENPYIGKDRKDYHDVEALIQANAEHNDRMNQKKPVKVDLTPIKIMDDLR